jgi:hypothetical protein
MKIVVRKREMDNMLHSPRGEVGKHMAKIGLKIVAAAKVQVGVKTGALRDSIHMRVKRTVFGGLKLEVGSPLSYAKMHHEGTRPHVIMPQRKTVLRFSSQSRVVYSREVKHPGTRPNKYLSDNLYLVKS